MNEQCHACEHSHTVVFTKLAVIQATYRRSKRFRNVDEVVDAASKEDGATSTRKKTVVVFRMFVKRILKTSPAAAELLSAVNTTVTIVWRTAPKTEAAGGGGGGGGGGCAALCADAGPRLGAASAVSTGSLRRDEDYLVMGHADRRRRQLELDDRSVIEPWKKNWPTYIQVGVEFSKHSPVSDKTDEMCTNTLFGLTESLVVILN
jgi:UNC-6/NTR/C345C module